MSWILDILKRNSFFFLLFRAVPTHLEVPRLGVESELQLLAYATARAISDLSHVCDLHHSSWQWRILNPLRETRDQTHNLMVPRWIHFRCATMGTPKKPTFSKLGSVLFKRCFKTMQTKK